MRKLLLAGAAALSLAACTSAGTDSGAGTAATPGTGGLINVNISDIRAEIAKNVDVALENVPITVQLPVTVAADVCGVNVNLLSVQINTAGNTCTATTTSPALEQAVVNQMNATG
jgi:hypothetical protein